MKRPVSALRFIGGGLVAVAVVLGCFGCAEGAERSAHPASGGAFDQDFSGPYGDDFQDAYARAGSDQVRRILADGVISGEEFAEAKSQVESCLGDNGYTIKYDDRGGFDVGSTKGSYDADFQKKMDPILRECERKHDGDVTYLYRQMVVNPAKVDDRSAIVKCLVASDLVPDDYSVRDFDRQNEDYSFPFGQFNAKGLSCMDDPLGLWATRR